MRDELFGWFLVVIVAFIIGVFTWLFYGLYQKSTKQSAAISSHSDKYVYGFPGMATTG